MWQILVILGLATFFLSKWVEARRIAGSKYREAYEKFPSPTELPIICSSWVFFGNPENIFNVFKRLAKTYGGRYRFKLASFMRETFVFNNPEDAEIILTSTTHITKGDAYIPFHPLLGEGLVTSTGDKWNHHRRLINPGFNFNILNNFLVTLNEHAKTFTSIIEKDTEGRDSLEIVPYIARFSLDSICSTAMGTHLNIQNNRESNYLGAIRGLANGIVNRTFQPWLRHPIFNYISPEGRYYAKCLGILKGFTTQVIQTRRVAKAAEPKIIKTDKEQIEEEESIYFSKRKRLALLDTLLEAEADPANNLSEADLRENSDTFMFAGHVTTKAAITWTTHYISTDPEVQARVHRELDDIFDGNFTRDIKYDDLSKMKYIEMCIKESMRLQPPGNSTQRYIDTDLVLADGTIIPAGADVVIPIITLHRHPQSFPDPEKFDPERFTLENSQNRHPYSYIPFSAGPRNCVGQKYAMMEVKVAISTIFRNFLLEPLQTRDQVKAIFQVVIMPDSNLPIKFHRRNNNPIQADIKT